MLHFKGKATFKCKQCGHKFEAFDTVAVLLPGRTSRAVRSVEVVRRGKQTLLKN